MSRKLEFVFPDDFDSTHFPRFVPHDRPAGLRASVDFCLSKLRGTKSIDLFQVARVDRTYPLAEQLKALSGMVAEGKFSHIGLSEACAATVKEANAVSRSLVASSRSLYLTPSTLSCSDRSYCGRPDRN